MSETLNLTRRIKKHLTGPIHSFFAVTGPGLEDLCLQELKAPPLSLTDAAQVPGGVAFRGRLHQLYGANLHLRTATRVLLRVARLPARAFGELEERVSQIPWELYLPWQTVPQVQATLHNCRLYHSGAVSQRVTRAIGSRWRDFADGQPGESRSQTLFVRGVGDRFMLSLDSSGDPLYLRGLKTQGGPAPLRETLAAAILKRAGYAPGMPLLDPMAGSGTFTLEAAMGAAGIPPGWQREFAFQAWPAFQPGRWRHWRRQAETVFAAPPGRPPILAVDLDPGACRALQDRLQETRLAAWAKVTPGDFFQLTPRQVAQVSGISTPGLIPLNPPFGRRLADPQSAASLVDAIGRHLIRHFRGWRIALLLAPQIDVQRLPISGKIHPVSHGGLALKLLIGRI